MEARATVVARPSPEPDSPFRQARRWVDLEFSDGSVATLVGNRRAVVQTALARSVYQAILPELQERLPDGVIVHGLFEARGAITARIDGLEALADIFAAVQYERFIRKVSQSDEWQDADEVLAARPGSSGDPVDLLSVPELGFDKRPEAFRRLFASRDPAELIRFVSRRSIVVPLPSADGGPRWYAWETVEDGHATYLFRPASQQALDDMLAWTQAPESKRSDLLRPSALQAQLAYVRRVLHHDDDEHRLGRWWSQLCAVVGLPDVE